MIWNAPVRRTHGQFFSLWWRKDPSMKIEPRELLYTAATATCPLTTKEELCVCGQRKRDACVSGGSFVFVQRDAQMVWTWAQLDGMPLTIVQTWAWEERHNAQHSKCILPRHSNVLMWIMFLTQWAHIHFKASEHGQIWTFFNSQATNMQGHFLSLPHVAP